MSVFRQIGMVCLLSLGSIPSRLRTSLVAVVGVAGVVAVLVSVLSMSTGLLQTIAGNGREDRAIVLNKGATAAAMSTVARSAAVVIVGAEGIKREAGADRPMAAASVIVPFELPTASGTIGNAPLRGTSPEFFKVHPEIHLAQGRMFNTAVREVIVGRAAQRQYKGLAVGQKITSRDSDWMIVGAFDANAGAIESELLGDAETVMSAYRRPAYQEVQAVLETPAALDRMRDSIAIDPTISVDVKRETDYLAEQARPFVALLRLIAYVVGGIMAVGAFFAAMNTMYSTVNIRTREIATLRAIGFGGGAVLTSVMIEAMLLALIGGAIGAAVAWTLFDGSSFSSSLVSGGAAQMGATFRVTRTLISTGITWALTLGFIGALLPAIRAARLPVATALQVR